MIIKSNKEYIKLIFKYSNELNIESTYTYKLVKHTQTMKKVKNLHINNSLFTLDFLLDNENYIDYYFKKYKRRLRIIQYRFN